MDVGRAVATKMKQELDASSKRHAEEVKQLKEDQADEIQKLLAEKSEGGEKMSGESSKEVSSLRSEILKMKEEHQADVDAMKKELEAQLSEKARMMTPQYKSQIEAGKEQVTESLATADASQERIKTLESEMEILKQQRQTSLEETKRQLSEQFTAQQETKVQEYESQLAHLRQLSENGNEISKNYEFRVEALQLEIETMKKQHETLLEAMKEEMTTKFKLDEATKLKGYETMVENFRLQYEKYCQTKLDKAKKEGEEQIKLLEDNKEVELIELRMDSERNNDNE